MNIIKTKKLVQGAMIAALFGVIALINTYTGGFFDIFFCYGMVAPLAWYGYHYSLKDNLITAFVSMIVIMMVSSPFFIVSSFSACLSGLYIGEILKRKASKGVLIFGVFVIHLFNNLMIYEVLAGILGMDLVSELTVMYNEVSSLLPYLTLDKVLSLVPLILISTSFMEMYVVVLLTQLILKRLKIDFPGAYHLAFLHLPKSVGLILITCVIVTFIMQSFLNIQHYLVMYVYLISYLILMVQGISFISYTLAVKRQYKYMIFVFFGVFVFHFIYLITGICDIFSDLRKNILYNESDVNKEEIV